MESIEPQKHLSETPYENLWSKAVQMHLTKFTNPRHNKESMVPTLDTVCEVEEDESYEDFKYALNDASHSTSLELDDDEYTAFDPVNYMWRLRQVHRNFETLPKKYIIVQISALSQQIDDLLKELDRRKRVESYILPSGFARSVNPYHWALNDFKSGSYRNIRGRGRGRLVYPEHDIHIRESSRVGAVVSDNKMLFS